MKKFAFILMGSHYTPETHTADFTTAAGQTTSIRTARDFGEAKELVKRLHTEGYGCIELCGAFGEALTRELIALTENEVAIGFVTHLPEQDSLFEAFFAS